MILVLFFEQCLNGIQKEFQLYSVRFIQSMYQMFYLDMFLPSSVADLLQNNSVTSKEALKILTQYFFNVIFFLLKTKHSLLPSSIFSGFVCFSVVYGGGGGKASDYIAIFAYFPQC